MDPLTAVGLASNVLSFVDFAAKLVRAGGEIAESTHGATVGNFELETATATLVTLCRGLGISANHGPKVTRPVCATTDASIKGIARASADIANELIEALKKLRSRDVPNKFVSIYSALKTILAKKDIDSLRDRLDRHQTNLQTALTISLRERWDHDLPQLNRKLRSGSDLDHMKADILDEIHRLHGAQKADKHALEISIAHQLSSMSKHQTDARLAFQIRERLAFDDQDERQFRIAEAHADTFRWVFQSPRESQEHQPLWSDFGAWLRGDESTYWVTGKPGSGKSTLMKYVASHSECLDRLHVWASTLPLIVTRFYLWNSGSQRQMSQDGLLRSILHQALTAKPELAQCFFPRRWDRSEAFGFDHSECSMSELGSAFGQLLSEADKGSFKLCMFVDGLDEFSGDLKYLVQLFQRAAYRRNVKVCLSSRPWPIFEEAFETKPNLLMQNITYDDIVRFVRTNFDANSGYRAISRREPRFAFELTENIARKACGVFLWVDLVVGSLLDGMTNYERVADLQDRLDEFPSDLEEFYQKMFDSIQKRHLSRACQYFRLTEAADGELTAIWLSFADEELTKLREVALLTRDISSEDAIYCYRSIERRLNSHCKGFLELTPIKHLDTKDRSFFIANVEIESPEMTPLQESELWGSKVSYHHRTAKDFLTSLAISKRVMQETEAYDTCLPLLYSIIAITNYSHRANICTDWSMEMRFAKKREFNLRLELIMKFAEQAEKRGDSDNEVLEVFMTRHYSPDDHKFLEMAVEHDLTSYVTWKVQQHGVCRDVCWIKAGSLTEILLQRTVLSGVCCAQLKPQCIPDGFILRSVLWSNSTGSKSVPKVSLMYWRWLLDTAVEVALSFSQQGSAQLDLTGLLALNLWADLVESFIETRADPSLGAPDSSIDSAFREHLPDRAAKLKRMLAQSRRPEAASKPTVYPSEERIILDVVPKPGPRLETEHPETGLSMPKSGPRLKVELPETGLSMPYRRGGLLSKLCCGR